MGEALKILTRTQPHSTTYISLLPYKHGHPPPPHPPLPQYLSYPPVSLEMYTPLITIQRYYVFHCTYMVGNRFTDKTSGDKTSGDQISVTKCPERQYVRCQHVRDVKTSMVSKRPSSQNVCDDKTSVPNLI
jgi:hypothetical protein